MGMRGRWEQNSRYGDEGKVGVEQQVWG